MLMSVLTGNRMFLCSTVGGTPRIYSIFYYLMLPQRDSKMITSSVFNLKIFLNERGGVKLTSRQQVKEMLPSEFEL